MGATPYVPQARRSGEPHPGPSHPKDTPGSVDRTCRTQYWVGAEGPSMRGCPKGEPREGSLAPGKGEPMFWFWCQGRFPRAPFRCLVNICSRGSVWAQNGLYRPSLREGTKHRSRCTKYWRPLRTMLRIRYTLSQTGFLAPFRRQKPRKECLAITRQLSSCAEGSGEPMPLATAE